MPKLSPNPKAPKVSKSAAQLIPGVAYAAGQAQGVSQNRQFEQARAAQLARDILSITSQSRDRGSVYGGGMGGGGGGGGGRGGYDGYDDRGSVGTYTAGGRVGTGGEAGWRATRDAQIAQDETDRKAKEALATRLAGERIAMKRSGIDQNAPEAIRYLDAIRRGEEPDEQSAAFVRGLAPGDYARVTSAEATQQRAQTGADTLEARQAGTYGAATRGGAGAAGGSSGTRNPQGLTPVQAIAEERRMREETEAKNNLVRYVQFTDPVQLSEQLADPKAGPPLYTALIDNDLPAQEHQEMLDRVAQVAGPSLKAAILARINDKFRAEKQTVDDALAQTNRQKEVEDKGREVDRLMQMGDQIREVREGGLTAALRMMGMSPEEYEAYLDAEIARRGVAPSAR